jgi:hypothetical protein
LQVDIFSLHEYSKLTSILPYSDAGSRPGVLSYMQCFFFGLGPCLSFRYDMGHGILA